VSITKILVSSLNTRRLTRHGNLMIIGVLYYRQKFLDLIHKWISNLDNQIRDDFRTLMRENILDTNPEQNTRFVRFRTW